MNTYEVGKKLVDLCKAGKNMEAVKTLYSPKIVSIEAHTGDSKMPARMEGFDAVRGKQEWWEWVPNTVPPQVGADPA